MEEWEIDFYWLKVLHFIKDSFKKEKEPDMDIVLFLIGVQELGRWKKEFSKEEKQDLISVAVCRLLQDEGYYSFEGRDGDGWPHWKMVIPIENMEPRQQELLLKTKIIQYFEIIEKEHKLL